ncbi:MAG: replicative DNA helicase [candidate division WWE3 bacterium]|nr:replicative DNA helicase [candidate division WWE3 bacterium]
MSQPKLPPQNVEAERSVLGALLLDRDAIIKVAEFLESKHFYKFENSLIYESILTLYAAHQSIDILTLSEELRRTQNLDKVGGMSYLTELAADVPTAAHVESYGRIIKDAAVRRSLISVSSDLTEMAFDERVSLSELLENSEQKLYGVSQETLRKDFVPLKNILSDSFDRLDELHKKAGGLRGVPTGLKKLDNMLSGLQDSNLIILAARPSVGKSSLALNIAQYAAVTEHIPVGFFSLEMSQEQLSDRLLAAQADIDAWKITTGNLTDDEFALLGDAMGSLAEAPIFIDDTAGANIMEMRTKARRLQMEHGVKLIIVDYLQLIHGRNLENRVQEVSEISQALKNIARELKVPVMALSQLSRAVEQRGGHNRPQLSDLRESGALEQDADVVMFLYREDDDNRQNIKLSVSKHRNGATGEIDLFFRGERTRFYEADTSHSE